MYRRAEAIGIDSADNDRVAQNPHSLARSNNEERNDDSRVGRSRQHARKFAGDGRARRSSRHRLPASISARECSEHEHESGGPAAAGRLIFDDSMAVFLIALTHEGRPECARVRSYSWHAMQRR